MSREFKLVPVLVFLSLSLSDMSFDNSLFAISTVSHCISWSQVAADCSNPREMGVSELRESGKTPESLSRDLFVS